MLTPALTRIKPALTSTFQIASRAGFAKPETSLEHVPFGLVLGEDGKKFKTRSGDTVKLMDLLDEAVTRTTADVKSRLETEGREEAEEFVDGVARAVGIGAVKYADLAMNRNSNYRFSFDKMLSLQVCGEERPQNSTPHSTRLQPFLPY